MIFTSSRKGVYLLFILSQMLNMSVINNEEISREEIRIDTQYAVEEFYLTWRIVNYSEVFQNVHADFFLKNSSTTWKLSLIDKAHIYLERIDNGEPVNVDIEYSLITRHKTFADKKFQKFESIHHPILQLLDLEIHPSRDKRVAPLQEEDLNIEMQQIPIKFDNDVFKLHCSMKVLGPPITKIVRSSDFLKI